MGAEKRRQPCEMESREWLFRGDAKNGGHPNARILRRLPVARGVSRTRSSKRRRPGPRQQRGLPARALRNASPRLLPKQDVRRRAGFSDLWTVSAAGERFASAGPVADLRHHISWPAL